MKIVTSVKSRTILQKKWFLSGIILGLITFFLHVRPIEALSFPSFPSLPKPPSIGKRLPTLYPLPSLPSLKRNHFPPSTVTPVPSYAPTPSPTSTPTPTIFSPPNSTLTPPPPNYGVFLQSDKNQYIDIGQGSIFNSLNQHATWEVWFKPKSLVNLGNENVLLSRWGTDSSKSWKIYLFTFQGDNFISIFLYNPSDPQATMTANAYVRYPYPLDDWTHVAWVFNGNGSTNTEKLQAYVNGQPQEVIINGASPNLPSSLYNPEASPSLQIGRNSDGTGYFDGVIDEVRVWNVSRTPSQILNNYQKTISGNEEGLVGYWKLNEGTGNLANDETTNNNNGTLINSPSWVSGVTF